MNKKKFDCVEMMHKGQAAVRKRLEGMTVEQKLDYWRKVEDEMREQIKKMQSKKAAAR